MFENISIGIKTFLRDEQLFNTIQAVRTNLPGAQLIVADCGDPTEEKDGIYADLERAGHKTIQLDFDAGFGAMSNAIAGALQRPYLLIGSDDFDFSTLEARHGIERLEQTLHFNPDFNIASGRVNNNPYEFFLREKEGVVTEVDAGCDRPNYWEGIRCGLVHAIVDLTVNYSMIRKEVFQKVTWDADVKIGGGEHAAFFIDCKRAGLKTVYVNGVNINEQPVRNSGRYKLYRNRAQTPERPCFVRRGIKKYVCGNGVVDYDESLWRKDAQY